MCSFAAFPSPPPRRPHRFSTCLAGVLVASTLAASGAAGQSKKRDGRQPADPEKPELVLQLRQQFSSHLIFSPDRKTVIGTNGPRILVWDVPSRLVRRTLESQSNWPGALALAPDGRTLAAVYGARVHFWDVRSGVQQAALQVPDIRITGLAFSADGLRLSTATGSGAIYEWNAQSRAPLGKYTGANRPASLLAYSPDGKRLAVARRAGRSADPGIEVWSTAKRARLWGALPGVQVLDLSYSWAGKQLAVATGSTVILESETGETFANPSVFGYSRTVAFHPRSELLARGAGDSVQVLSTRNWEVVRGGQEVSPGRVRWSPDGKVLGSVGVNRLIRLHRPDTNEGPIVLGKRGQRMSMVASPDGRLLSFRVGTKLQLFDCLTGALRPELPSNPGAAPAQFLPGSHTLIGAVRQWTADSNGNPRDEHLRLWDVDQGSLLGEVPPPAPRGTYATTDWVTASPDGRLIATGASRGPFLIWDARTLKQVGVLARTERDGVFSPVFAGSRYFAAVNSDALGFSVWDVENGKLLWSKTDFPGHVLRLATTPKGDLLAAQALSGAPSSFTAEGPVRLYRIPDGTLVGTLPSTGQKLSVLKFSPDGSLLAAADSSGRIQWWSVADRTRRGEVLGHANAVEGLAFTPGGDLLSTGVDGTVRLWDLRAGKWRLTWIFELDLEPKPGPPMDITLAGWLVLTPEGYYTAHGAADRLIRWRRNDRLFPASQFEDRFRKPKRINAILSQSLR